MINQKERNLYKFSDREKESSKPVHSWSAQYDEEDDFLSKKVPDSESAQEE
jgi:hypothetical protein